MISENPIPQKEKTPTRNRIDLFQGDTTATTPKVTWVDLSFKWKGHCYSCQLDNGLCTSRCIPVGEFLDSSWKEKRHPNGEINTNLDLHFPHDTLVIHLINDLNRCCCLFIYYHVLLHVAYTGIKRIQRIWLKLTPSSLDKGLWLHTISLTEMQTGNAIPLSIAFPFTFLVYTFWDAAFITVCPNSQISKTFAPGIHWPTIPCRAKLTILAASWYLVQTSL